MDSAFGLSKAFLPYKSLGVPEVGEVAARIGLGAEVSSEREALLAAMDGTSDNGVVVNGPHKENALFDCLRPYRSIFQIDSLGEMGLCSDLARSDLDIEFVVRLALEKFGRVSRFGILLSEYPSLVDEAYKLGIRVSGIHLHLGNYSADLRSHYDAIAAAAPILGDLSVRFYRPTMIMTLMGDSQTAADMIPVWKRAGGNDGGGDQDQE